MRRGRRSRVWRLSPDGFRELRPGCLLSRHACAEYLGVTVRTVRNWDVGRYRVPWSAVRLLRLLRCGELGALDAAWDGFRLLRGVLYTPDNRGFPVEALRCWWLTVEQARYWRNAYDRRAGRPTAAAGSGRVHGADAQPGLAQGPHKAAQHAPAGCPPTPMHPPADSLCGEPPALADTASAASAARRSTEPGSPVERLPRGLPVPLARGCPVHRQDAAPQALAAGKRACELAAVSAEGAGLVPSRTIGYRNRQSEAGQGVAGAPAGAMLTSKWCHLDATGAHRPLPVGPKLDGSPEPTEQQQLAAEPGAQPAREVQHAR